MLASTAHAEECWWEETWVGDDIQRPQVTVSGDIYLVRWRVAGILYKAAVDRRGEVIRQDEISLDYNHSGPGKLYPGAGGYLRAVVAYERSIVLFTRLDRFGDELGQSQVPVAAGTTALGPMVAYTGSHFVAAWYEHRQDDYNTIIKLARLSPEGEVIGAETIYGDNSSEIYLEALLATKGVIWVLMREDRADAPRRLLGQRLSTSGELLGEPIVLAENGDVFAAASDGREALIIFSPWGSHQTLPTSLVLDDEGIRFGPTTLPRHFDDIYDTRLIAKAGLDGYLLYGSRLDHEPTSTYFTAHGTLGSGPPLEQLGVEAKAIAVDYDRFVIAHVESSIDGDSRKLRLMTRSVTTDSDITNLAKVEETEQKREMVEHCAYSCQVGAAGSANVGLIILAILLVARRRRPVARRNG